jgi:hypothetical protein
MRVVIRGLPEPGVVSASFVVISLRMFRCQLAKSSAICWKMNITPISPLVSLPGPLR